MAHFPMLAVSAVWNLPCSLPKSSIAEHLHGEIRTSWWNLGWRIPFWSHVRSNLPCFMVKMPLFDPRQTRQRRCDGCNAPEPLCRRCEIRCRGQGWEMTISNIWSLKMGYTPKVNMMIIWGTLFSEKTISKLKNILYRDLIYQEFNRISYCSIFFGVTTFYWVAGRKLRRMSIQI